MAKIMQQLDLFGDAFAAPEKEAKPVVVKKAKEEKEYKLEKPETILAEPEEIVVATKEEEPITIIKEPVAEIVLEPKKEEPTIVLQEPVQVAEIKQEDAIDFIIDHKPNQKAETVLAPIKRRGRKSQKQMEIDAAFINVPSDELLFQKQYYTMGQVCAMFNVNHSLLRYWEAEFTVLKPRKNRKGDRLFRPEDVKSLEIIYRLTRVKKLTIQGAKEYFTNEKIVAKKFELVQQMEQAKSFLLELKAKL